MILDEMITEQKLDDLKEFCKLIELCIFSGQGSKDAFNALRKFYGIKEEFEEL